MGLNIPYTHGECQPSQQLLLKSAVAGAYTQLLFLLSRTPGTPAITEIKPGAAIAWGEINYGPVKKGVKGVLLDKDVIEVDLNHFNQNSLEDRSELKSNQFLEAPYLDSGENGFFSLEEFRTITSLNQMEFVRPEDIAAIVWMELIGKSTGRNIIDAFESTVLPPSYNAGYSRSEAINKLETLLKDHHSSSVAFELLGPPKLSKLLFEAYLILSITSNPNDRKVREIVYLIEEYLQKNKEKLLSIVSTGIPILLGDGKTLYRGSAVKVKTQNFKDLESVIDDGWIDLREKNLKQWQNRIQQYLQSHPQADLLPGNLAAYIFQQEYKGYRII
jgi:hypothetical protein